MRLVQRIKNFATNQNRRTVLSYDARQRFLDQFDEFQANEAAREVADLLRPRKLPELEWIGSRRDGGYALARQSIVPPRDWAISIGVGQEVSADVALAAGGFRVYLFDPYVDEPRLPNQNLVFYKKGLGSKSPDLLPLSDLVEHCEEDGPPSILLLDIEGAEWASLGGEAAALRLFDQIAIELHGLGDLANPKKAERIVETLRALTQSHTPVFWRANNHGGLLSIGGYCVPDLLEVSLVRNSLLAELPESTSPSVPALQNSKSLPPIFASQIFSHSLALPR